MGDSAPGRPLTGLLEALERWSTERQALLAGCNAGLPGAGEWPGLPGLQEARGLWAQLRSREQLRRALLPAPAEAGPLNSRVLASRMLRLMHGESPGYLRHFTAYVDMLAGLQALHDRNAVTPAGRPLRKGASTTS